jgi:hypothetical protein
MSRPGVTSKTRTPREFLLDGQHVIRQAITIVSTARDNYDSDGSTAHTPTTTLRRGLVLGKITASGKLSQYDDTNEDGSQVAVGILDGEVDLLDEDNTAQDTQATMVIHAFADESELLGIDANGKTDLAHIIFG